LMLTRYPLFQVDFDCVARLLADCSSHLRFHWQHMGAVTHSHKRTSKRMSINRSLNLHQSLGSKENYWVRPDNVRPPALMGAFS
jgi:hypothetical protein